jgi:hypothetical protein
VEEKRSKKKLNMDGLVMIGSVGEGELKQEGVGGGL